MSGGLAMTESPFITRDGFGATVSLDASSLPTRPPSPRSRRKLVNPDAMRLPSTTNPTSSHRSAVDSGSDTLRKSGPDISSKAADARRANDSRTRGDVSVSSRRRADVRDSSRRGGRSGSRSWRSSLGFASSEEGLRDGPSDGARGGVAAMVKTLAFEWAEYGIRLNCVAPGTVKTEAMGHYPIAPEQWLKLNRNIMGHMGDVEDIAAAIIFLASPLGKFVTGEEWYIDGGETLHLAHDARQMIDAAMFATRERGDRKPRP